MAVAQISAYLFTGLSGDSKPAAGVATTGARFIETNTGAEFVFTGAAWVEVSPKTRDGA